MFFELRDKRMLAFAEFVTLGLCVSRRILHVKVEDCEVTLVVTEEGLNLCAAAS